MATLNKTRVGTRNQKKGVSVAHAKITVADVLANADVAELVGIPKNALLVRAELNVKVAFNAGTSITILGKLGAATLFAAMSIATTGVKTLTFTKLDSGVGALLTITNAIVGAVPTVGEADLMVEFIEYEKNTGELMEYSSTV